MNNALRTDFKRKCKEHTSDLQELAHLESLFEEKPEVRDIPENSLWKALNFPLRWVQVHALYELFRRRDMASKEVPVHNEGGTEPVLPNANHPSQVIDLPVNTRIVMLGQHAWTLEDLAPALARQGYSLVAAQELLRQDQPQASQQSQLPQPQQPQLPQSQQQHFQNDAIMLGPAPGEWINHLPKGIRILKEEEVTSIALKSGMFYLLDQDRQVERGNLKTMLLSSQITSIELGLEIMSKGGMPPHFTTILFSLKRSRLPFRLRQMASNFLLRYTSGVLKRNLMRNYFDLLGGDRQLLATDFSTHDPDGVLNLDEYLRLNFQLSKGGQQNGENLVSFHHGLVGLKDDFTVGILECLESERRLRFPKTTLHFPPITYQMEHLKSIEIYNAPLTELPEGISKLPSLIRIWFNCPLESLPSDLGESQSIKMVNLFNGNFSAFPESLTQLRRLKIFRWENSLAKPDQILELPEALFELPLDTAIIIEQKVKFPVSFFQTASLKSLALSYQSATNQLREISQMGSLQRIRLQFEPQEKTNLSETLENLPGWKLEDQNERNYSFARK